MEFRILGPLEVAVDSRCLEPGGARQQVVLATLLLGANRVVSVDRLLEAIYGEDRPATARAQAQMSISALRRLFAAHGCATTISTRAQGYLLQADSGQHDLLRFEELVAAARTAQRAADVDQAVASYREALDLWRGNALDGIASQLVQAGASRLNELRITTIEDRLTLELDLGRHRGLVGELAELVEQFPLREPLRGQLMLALYRCGRTAEALEVYRQARRMMIDELGIEPGDPLQRLERSILTRDPALDLAAERITVHPSQRHVPGLLPADIADFTGRAEQVEEIRRQLGGAGLKARLAVPIVVITGRGGVGKTSLAVHAAHSVASRFPDGQLFADLHGGSPQPAAPAKVLERFLRALGAPGPQLPDGLDERAEMYRNLLADRKTLVVLDDAADESQVSPLLPGTSAAGVIVTCRSRLAGLAGATRIELSAFGAETSLDLLARIAGPARVRAEPEAAATVAEQCEHLPLALRIAGSRLSARPHWSIQQLAGRLADETRRLDELKHGAMGVRPSIAFSYESAGEQQRQLFRRLALLDLPVFSGWLSAALVDQPAALAQDVLDDLVSAQLVEVSGPGSGVHSQYRVHDLIRAFARERLAAEEPAAERTAALERALGALLYVSEQAHFRYYGGDYIWLHSEAKRWPLPQELVEQLISDPLAWYERERGTLAAGVRQAGQAGLTDLCWSLARSAVTLYEARAYYDDWQETHEIALEAARKADNAAGQAAMLYSTGTLHLARQRFGLARSELTAAAELFEQTGDAKGLALTIFYTSYVDRLSGQLDDAARRCEQALAIFRRTGDDAGAAFVLQDLAQVKIELGEFDEARTSLSDALRLSQLTGCGRVEAEVQYHLGEACLAVGDLNGAVQAFHLGLTKIREVRDPVGEAYALLGTGTAKMRQGQFAPSRSALQRALELTRSVGDRLAEARALLGLSELARTSGDPGPAVVAAQQAASLCRAIGAPLYEARALTLLSDAHAALSADAAAEAASSQAAALRAKFGGQAVAEWPADGTQMATD